MITEDRLFSGKLNFLQYKNGYRFSIDSPLLANFSYEDRKNLTYLDIGTGVGVIPIILEFYDRKKNQIDKIYGVELQKELFELAQRSIDLNNSKNIELINTNIKDIDKYLKPNSIDVVVSNPPYYKIGNGRVSPNTQKSIAKHELELNIKDIVKVSNYLLKANGVLKLIYPIERFFDLTQILLEKKFGIARVIFIHPIKGKAAKLFMIEAVKGVEKDTQFLPAINIHVKGQEYTDFIKDEVLFID